MPEFMFEFTDSSLIAIVFRCDSPELFLCCTKTVDNVYVNHVNEMKPFSSFGRGRDSSGTCFGEGRFV